MFPGYFTRKTRSKSWSLRAALRRQNASSEEEAHDLRDTGANVVGRIYTVSPREGERYFLRLILTHFENLRNIDGRAVHQLPTSLLTTRFAG